MCGRKSRVISAVCAAQALADRCLASINILISAPPQQWTTFILSTEMSSEWRSGRCPAMRASSAWVKSEPVVPLVVKKNRWRKQKPDSFKGISIIWNERCCVSEPLVCLPVLYVPGEDGNSKNSCHQMVVTLMNIKKKGMFSTRIPVLDLVAWSFRPPSLTDGGDWQAGRLGW